MSRRVGAVAAALVLLVAGAVLAYRLELLSSTKVETGELAPAEPAEPAPGIDHGRRPSWPMFRFDQHRTGVNPDATAKPPFRVEWSKPTLGLNEVPPAMHKGVIVGATYGNTRSFVYARRSHSGRLMWRRRFGRGKNFAGGPAIAGGRVFVPAHDGLLRVFDLRTGKVRWRFRARPNEGPPVVSNGVVYFGDGSGGVGEMYALDVRRKRVKWRFRAQDHISSGAALTRQTLYFGSYDGSVYALNRNTGRLRWRSRATDALGRGVGFFATPAIVRGMVIVGGLDGNVYAFDSRSGRQRWRQGLDGREIYGSAAVAGGTVFVGSFGGTFAALDARTGRRRWTARPGPNIGSPSVVGKIVYMSTLQPTRSFGYDVGTGRQVWRFRDGKYSPVLADGRDLWLVGKARLYRLVPRKSKRSAGEGRGKRESRRGAKRSRGERGRRDRKSRGARKRRRGER